MKVLHIGLSCANGGAESFLATLIREQRKNGIEADVAFVSDLGASGQFGDLCRVIFADRELLDDALLSGGYDVIHLANHATLWSQHAIKRTRFGGAIVTTYHIWGDRNHNIRESAVVGVSKAMTAAVQPEYIETVRTVYNGIDTDFFSPGKQTYEGKPIIAWIGRSNDAAKDVGALIAIAMSPVAKKFQIVILDGSPPGEEFRSHWLPENASIQVRRPWLEMPDFYRQVAASKGFLLSTARAEPFGLNAIEAQACGCPAIVPNAGGICEVVEHKSTGYVYELSGGVVAVTEAVNWLYSDDSYRTASVRAVDYIKERFTVERMCREYTEIYQAAIETRSSKSLDRAYRTALRAALPALKQIATIRKKS
ncbi:MAG: glycosyltransferase family 4 protein [Armatimonadota bacterium]